MESQSVLQSQYHAALKMLREAITKCPKSMWNDFVDGVPFWRVAYHVLSAPHRRAGEPTASLGWN